MPPHFCPLNYEIRVEQKAAVIISNKRGNGPTCATSSRSRERENKNENRDNYLHKYNIVSLLNNCCKFMNRLLTIAGFRHFLTLFNAKMKSKSDICRWI